MPYEYGSVMQYGASGASRNGKPVMIAKVPPYQDTMGSDMVSFYDISMMNEHYQCKGLVYLLLFSFSTHKVPNEHKEIFNIRNCFKFG